MTHPRRLAALILLAGLLAWSQAACNKGGLGVAPCDEDGVCDTAAGESHDNCPSDCDAPPVCNDNGVCESAAGENSQNCLADCPPPPVCNGNGICEAWESVINCPVDCPPAGCDFDGVCEPGNGENAMNCAADCGPTCELAEMTGPYHDFLVQELFIPDTSQSAGDNGVDLDGDGDIDNKLGQVIQLFLSNGVEDDINAMVNGQILAGNLMMMTRVRESGNYDGGVAVQSFQGLSGPPPAFDGTDHVLLDPSSAMDLWLCGRWAPPRLETTPSELVIALPMPMIGMLPMTLSYARIETVVNPASPFYGSSELRPDLWDNVMVGGGLTQDEISGSLVPALAAMFQDLVSQGGATADTIVDLFDGNCAPLDDVPGCENVVPGQGACDGSASPPVITTTEVLCNALMSSALAPDVDVDGDGEHDLLSVGLRIVRAVPVSISWP